MAREPGRPGQGQLGPGQPGQLGELLVNLGELPVQLAIANDSGPADQGQVSWAAATAGQGSWG
jgi:hypothetical protein